jgi:hypothetical protein
MIVIGGAHGGICSTFFGRVDQIYLDVGYVVSNYLATPKKVYRFSNKVDALRHVGESEVRCLSR